MGPPHPPFQTLRHPQRLLMWHLLLKVSQTNLNQSCANQSMELKVLEQMLQYPPPPPPHHVSIPNEPPFNPVPSTDRNLRHTPPICHSHERGLRTRHNPYPFPNPFHPPHPHHPRRRIRQLRTRHKRWRFVVLRHPLQRLRPLERHTRQHLIKFNR